MVADHGMGIGAIGRPVVASAVVALVGQAWRKCPTMRIRSRKYVVFLRGALGTTEPVHKLASFRYRSSHIDEVAATLNIAMQICEAGRYHDPVGIVPRSVADTITCVDGRHGLAALGAEISAPGAIARADGARQTLALGVGTSEAAEIAMMCGARDKETQRWLRFLALGQNSGRTQSDGRDYGKNDVSMGHDASPLFFGFIPTNDPVRAGPTPTGRFSLDVSLKIAFAPPVDWSAMVKAITMTRPIFCASRSERVYFTAWGCEMGFLVL